MKIGSALLLGMLIIMVAPRAKQMLHESPEAEAGDWSSFLIPILVVGGFVALLMWLV